MIPCKKCGELNPIDRIFCLKCAEKLDKTGPEALQRPVPPLKKNVQIRKESLAATLLTYLFFTFLFLSLCLFFYNGHIPEPVLSLSSARNLDHKLLLLTQEEPYISLNQEEVNIYLEREWSKAKDSLTAALPSFIRLKRIFVTLHDHDLTLYLHFMIRQVPIFISFFGIPEADNQKLHFLARKSSIGALRLPLLLTHSLVKPLLAEASDPKRFDLPYGIQSLDMAKATLFVYKNPASRDASKPSAEAPTPSDLLLVQAADVCLSKNEREKAEKYLRLALLHYPATPLKSHILDQLKLCDQKKEGDA